MAGVMSLMQPQQGPMPGQAPQQPMQGMMPQQGAPTPAAMVGPLTQMHMQQLMQLMLNPRPEGPPLYAVISALAEKQKAAKAAQNAQGQQAMAQNAQMQQQPPVAAQVMQSAEQMQQPVMAAYGGEMQGYASGGAVSFQTAGAVPPGLMNPDVDEDGLPRGKDERERVIDYNNKIRAAYEQQMKSKAAAAPRTAAPSMQDIAGAMSGRRQLEQFYKPRNPEAYTPEALAYRVSGMSPADAPGRGMAEERVIPQAAPQAAPQPSPTTFDISSPSSINALRIAAQDTTLPESERADLQRRIAMMEGQRQTPIAVASTSPGMAIQGEMSPEERKTYADYRAMMEGRKVRPESLVKAEQGLGELAQANIAAQRAESERMAREAQERRDAAIGRSQRSILSDPQALLALAGSIDTRKGQGIGSLARGAAGLLGQREASAEAARKEYATSQQAQRAMDAAIRQTQMLEAQRQVAVETGKYDLVNQLDEKIAQSKMAEQAAARDVRNKAIDQTRLARSVDAQVMEAGAKVTTAGRPTETTRLLQELGLTPTLENLGALAGARQPAGAAGRPMTYNEASDNVQKLLDSPSGMMEVMNIRKQAKAAGKPEPSIIEVKEMLIQREMQGASASRSGAPTGGKIMTMADIQATASSSGKTPEEVRKAAISAGYTIQ